MFQKQLNKISKLEIKNNNINKKAVKLEVDNTEYDDPV